MCHILTSPNERVLVCLCARTCTDGSRSDGEEEEGKVVTSRASSSNTWHVSIQLWNLETFTAFVLIIRWLQLWHQLHMVSVQQPKESTDIIVFLMENKTG